MTLRKPIDVGCMWQMWGIVRIELLSYLQWNGRYVQLNISGRISKTAITVDWTGHRVDIVQNGWCAPCLAANEEYNAHRIYDIPPISEEIRLIAYWSLNIPNTQIHMYPKYRVDIAQPGWCALSLAANVRYNADRIVEISQMETLIRSIEYFRQNLQNCSNAVLDRAQTWHGVNRTMCAVFGRKFGEERASNCGHITNNSGDALNWILKPEYAVLI
jgi:hypothetical protein